jgi:hypothetical protein
MQKAAGSVDLAAWSFFLSTFTVRGGFGVTFWPPNSRLRPACDRTADAAAQRHESKADTALAVGKTQAIGVDRIAE